MHSQSIIAILVGCVLLTFGRKLFWLFVGAVGFGAGIEAGTYLLAGQSQSTILIAALVLGLIGIVIALFLQKLAVAIAGFAAGAYLAFSLVQMAGEVPGHSLWVAGVIGGIVGVVLMLMLFEWTLIVLSALFGASMIVERVHFHAPIATIALIGLSIVGIVFQARSRRRVALNE
ncbi:MAG: hypothetical protein QOD99_1012 [Chthoniobacter sp.]|nr:hypothetical protein [Chthoniobacter sp.]